MDLREEHHSSDSCSDEENDLFDTYSCVYDDEDQFICEDEDQFISDSCEVISTEHILKEMGSCISEVATVTDMEPTIIRMLLNHLKWNKEKLYELYFNGNGEKLLSEAQVVKPRKSSNKINTGIDYYVETCLICYREDMKAESLACGHKFCVDCWKEYLKTKIMEEGAGMNISCAASDCDILVDDQTVMKLINDAEIIKRYQLLITKTFVDSSSVLRWCPQPNCDNVYKAELAIMQPVTCACRYKCCFACLEIWHEPVDCKLLKKWRSKCSEDAESAEWLTKNTKECPNCCASIEKNGGCNYMKCTNASCGTGFCWLCLKRWKDHMQGNIGCNYYKEDSSSYDPTRKSSVSDVRRYLFYCERYMNHMKNLQYGNKLYSLIEHYAGVSMAVSEIPYYQKSVDILCECRRTLMHTYVFAYYMKRSSQLDIFLENQKDLEIATEELSRYLEEDLRKKSMEHLSNIQEKSGYCKNRYKVLLNHVKEGYDSGWWELL